MVNVSGIAGTTMGIMGMGIGISILARTARDIADMNRSTMTGRPVRRTPYQKPRTYRPRPMSFKPRNSYKMKSMKYKPKLMKFY